MLASKKILLSNKIKGFQSGIKLELRVYSVESYICNYIAEIHSS